MHGRAIDGAATAVAIGRRAGTYSVTQPSSVATSGATPRGDGNVVASSAGNRSMTVSRVSMVVPCLAKTAPAMAAEKTTRPRSCNRTKASRQTGLSGETTRPGDRDQPPAFGEPRQGRRDMAQGSVRHAAIDVGDRRERRVHQHDARRDAGVEMIVDMRGVEARDGDAGKEMRKKSGAGLGELVENERRAGQLGEDGEQARCRPKAPARHPSGVIAAAVLAAKPSRSACENC